MYNETVQGVAVDEKLKNLLEIQTIDIRIDEIRKEKESTPKDIEALKDGIDLLEKNSKQDRIFLEELVGSRIQTEKELEEMEIKLAKSKARLDNVKSNKEYQAVLKEIEDLKEISSAKEEKVIACMEEVEIQEKECANNNVKLEKIQKDSENKVDTFKRRTLELDKELQSLTEKRSRLYQESDKDLIDLYNRLKGNLKGKVVVPIVSSVCHGCNLGIPQQQYNELIKTSSSQTCPNCNRIIYWEEEGNFRA